MKKGIILGQVILAVIESLLGLPWLSGVWWISSTTNANWWWRWPAGVFLIYGLYQVSWWYLGGICFLGLGATLVRFRFSKWFFLISIWAVLVVLGNWHMTGWWWLSQLISLLVLVVWIGWWRRRTLIRVPIGQLFTVTRDLSRKPKSVSTK